MESVKLEYYLLCADRHPHTTSIDIMEHLPTLRKYSAECNSVFETGVRGCVSSWAFLYGLLENESPERKRLFMNDIDICDISRLENVSKDLNIDVTYKWCNNLSLTFDDTYDITFIDTWHIYGQLKRELEKFSKITNKYIIMHDTTIDAIYGETIRGGLDANRQSEESGYPVQEILRGLWPAIEEFLQNNEEWYIKERYTNNNGLTILARK